MPNLDSWTATHVRDHGRHDARGNEPRGGSGVRWFCIGRPRDACSPKPHSVEEPDERVRLDCADEDTARRVRRHCRAASVRIGSMQQQQQEPGRAAKRHIDDRGHDRGLAGHLASGDGHTGEGRSAHDWRRLLGLHLELRGARRTRGCRLAQRLQQRTRRTSDHARRVRRQQRSRQGKRLREPDAS